MRELEIKTMKEVFKPIKPTQLARIYDPDTILVTSDRLTLKLPAKLVIYYLELSTFELYELVDSSVI